MIFIVKDEHNEERDRKIARHVMNVHQRKDDGDHNREDVAGEVSIEKMKRYVSYCKR